MCQVITTPCFAITVTLADREGDRFVGGSITSGLHEKEDGTVTTKQYNAAMDALESIILSHAIAGIDICSPAYLEGIETALDACGRNFS